MAIITISRGSFSKGRAVAEKVAKTLGYDCISREVLLEASEHFNIDEIKLEHALHDAPSILERFTHGRERYLAYFNYAFLERVQKNNVVYHGLAGQFFLKGVSHVLKVRILAEMQDRVALEMEREGLTRKQALQRLHQDDEARRQWSKQLYGVDTWDSSLYDMVLHVHTLSVDDIVGIICNAVSLPHFETTPESLQLLDDLLLTSRVRAELVSDYPTARVHAEKGIVTIDVEFNQTVEPGLTNAIQEMTASIEGVKGIRMHPIPITPYAHS